nr:hypothetical protein CoNPh38_CDS0272 [Staphylococcus phage S-CoN_Ph38]
MISILPMYKTPKLVYINVTMNTYISQVQNKKTCNIYYIIIYSIVCS